MGDPFLRKVIVACASRLLELKPLGANITVSIPPREYMNLLVEPNYNQNEDVILNSNDNILIWNLLIYCLTYLSTPIIPFELIHKRPITLELACFIIATMPAENIYPFEMILNAINITLFPDLRVMGDNEDSLISEESDVGAYFPNVVSTIGMAICRPMESGYKSVLHKQGMDEIGTLLTYILDNRKWLFHLCLPSQAPSVPEGLWVRDDQGNFTLSSTQPEASACLPLRPLSPTRIQQVIQSGIHSLPLPHTPNTFHTIHTALEVRDRNASFLEPGPHALQPQPCQHKTAGMNTDQIIALVGNALSSAPNHILSNHYDVKTAGDVVYEYASMDGLAEEEEELACLVLQCLIRKANTQFVHRVIQKAMISPVPKRPKNYCFCLCPRTPIDMPYIDFTGYFLESDWEKSSRVEQMSREELLTHVQTLQLQLCDVEERLTSSDKKSIILNNSFLMHKYSIYKCIIDRFNSK